MRRVLALVWLNVAQILRDRGALFSMIALPLLLTTLMGFMMGGGADDTVDRLAVALVDEDGGRYAVEAGRLLRAQESLEVTATAREAAERGIRDGDLAAAVVVPKGFGDAVEAGSGAELVLLKAPDVVNGMAVQQIVSGIAQRMAANVTAAREAGRALDEARETYPLLEAVPDTAAAYAKADARWEPRPPISVKALLAEASVVRGDSTVAGGFKQSSLGMTVWFILMILMGSAEGILEERENGTFGRLLTTPMRRSTLLLGKIAGIYVIGILQAALLIGFGALVFKVPWGSDPLPVVLIVAAYTLVCTGFAVALSAIARTRSQAAAAAPVISVSLAMLGGSAWPLEIVPPFMKTAALMTPPGWAMAGLTDVVVRNQGIASAVTPTLVLLGFAAASFGVAMAFLKFE